MKKIFLFILFLGPLSIFAQSVRVTANSTHAWYMLNGFTKIKGNLSFFHDVQFRRGDFFSEKQQLLLRGGFAYDFNDKIQGMTGYAYVSTAPYGDYPVKNTFDEHRAFEQIQVKQTLGKVNLFQRYRLEQRWLGSAALGGFNAPRFENRMRFMARLNFPILTTGKIGVYANIYDEIFINFGKKVAYNIFDQNRWAANIGIKFNKNISLEVGYLLQTLQQRNLLATNQTVFEQNNTLTTALITKF